MLGNGNNRSNSSNDIDIITVTAITTTIVITQVAELSVFAFRNDVVDFFSFALLPSNFLFFTQLLI